MQLTTQENLFSRSYRCAPILKTARSSLVLMALAVTGPIHAQNLIPSEVREFIAAQVGGIKNLIVQDEAHLPSPFLPGADGSGQQGVVTDPAFQTTAAKKYLGKLLYFDPVRRARILPRFDGALAPTKSRRPLGPRIYIC